MPRCHPNAVMMSCDTCPKSCRRWRSGGFGSSSWGYIRKGKLRWRRTNHIEATRKLLLFVVSRCFFTFQAGISLVSLPSSWATEAQMVPPWPLARPWRIQADTEVVAWSSAVRVAVLLGFGFSPLGRCSNISNGFHDWVGVAVERF